METYHHDKTMLHGAKFIRRTDLPPLMRPYNIGVTALLAQRERVWGKLTALTRELAICRTFVYMLAYQVEQAGVLLFEQRASASWPSFRKGQMERLAYQYMVSLRVEGCCSLGAVATIMKRFGVGLSSTGKISQSLHTIGAL